MEDGRLRKLVINTAGQGSSRRRATRAARLQFEKLLEQLSRDRLARIQMAVGAEGKQTTT